MKECCETGDTNPKRKKAKRYFNLFVAALIIVIAVASLVQWIMVNG